MEGEARVAIKPRADFGMFVGGVIIEDNVHGLVAGHAGIDRVQKADELLMPVLLHVAPDHGAVENVERCKQRSGPVTLVIMGHRAEPALFEREPRLGPVERLYLALLVK